MTPIAPPHYFSPQTASRPNRIHTIFKPYNRLISMSRIFDFLKDKRVISALGLLLGLAVIYLVASIFHLTAKWSIAIALVFLAVWTGYRVMQWQQSRRASDAMDRMFQNQAEEAVKTAPTGQKQDVEILRKRLLEAIQTIKTSKLGQTTGSAALYEMPWYIIIGNPAAGKSTAVINSGLNFPFSDKGGQAVQGLGGTRNCDWFFTTEGILLDTAGRYAVHEEDRSEWFGFLGLLKKYRPKAPINGIVIVASIAELTNNRPEVTINLAKQLRQRVQELTERLELFAPVYVMFTKVDLIAGFVDFFEDSDAEERSRVWGATLPYDMDGKSNAVLLFDQHFDALSDGIKELGSTRMSLNRGQAMSPGILTFPMEFIGIKQHLRTFIATLFEENPFQFKPVFRGFYFTSAVQEGVATHATGQRIVHQYGLSIGRKMTASISSNTGFFLRNLFSSVIFADRNLVRQYASRNKLLMRQAAFFGGVLILGLLLGGWSWSFITNRQLVTNVQADLEKVVKIQETGVDLASRLEALEIMQDRLEQLQRYRTSKPLALGFSLYQGERVEHMLRAEYFKGLQQVMLAPVAANLESFLGEVNANAGKLESAVRPPSNSDTSATGTTTDTRQPRAGSALYKDVSPTNPEDAYNALKTYLMLASCEHIDAGHLEDQITRFWRNWLEAHRGNAPREQVIRSAEKLITFYLAQAQEPDFPLIENKLALVDQARETLRVAIKGTPARERVYSEIRMRAATRFPTVTVAGIVGDQNKEIVAGSHAVSGAFTHDAWEQFIEAAIKEASTKELQSADWVLKTTARDDLSLEGSPEQIQRELVRMYKTEYINEWKKFAQGITITDFGSFDKAVAGMNRLGDPISSPLNILLQTLYRETTWDNPSLVNQGLQSARNGIVDWFRATVLRQTPSQLNVNLAATKPGEFRMGMIGQNFAAIANLVVVRGENKDSSLINGYLAQLSKVRTRFNQIKNSGDVGPASRLLMQSTLDGSNSELSEALKYVDESMLTGMPDAERSTIRPLLVRPLMQAFAAIVQPTEAELNRTWAAQIFEPFNKSLGTKYPFVADSRVEATPAEIAQVFGPDGAIAKFVQTTMGPLVVRRGDTMSARTWADMGLHLNSSFTQNLARFIAAQGASPSSASGNTQPQTNFQLQPLPTPGLVEYRIEIDGQSLRYRNGRQDWLNFTWPSALGQPGAKITAITADGRSVDVVDFPGQFGLEKLINSAQRKKLDNGMFSMSWTGGGTTVSVNFKLISDSRNGSNGSGAASETGLRGLKLPATVAGIEG
ncbi:type VI secretion system membrane subunit TssM [Noviherbaspirillum sp.]|uniref:type VI secretion system membrane subunit TssM n=1 Tax=Noviherbaspirillum sp. TaxID=1926288 RepID=UPI002B4A2804|nr:type VI secretion system membrane subunit TssM [Noviherbaspirillum sp.]HJV82751.1 type VI secretion system membrane subunit TssM [Noviherbaspirillum sp.]